MSKNVFFCGKERTECKWGTMDIPVLPFYVMPSNIEHQEEVLQSRGIIIGEVSYIAKFGSVPTINGYYFFEEYASEYVYAMKCKHLDEFVESVLEDQKYHIGFYKKHDTKKYIKLMEKYDIKN